jgi:hypothetical protein
MSGGGWRRSRRTGSTSFRTAARPTGGIRTNLKAYGPSYSMNARSPTGRDSVIVIGKPERPTPKPTPRWKSAMRTEAVPLPTFLVLARLVVVVRAFAPGQRCNSRPQLRATGGGVAGAFPVHLSSAPRSRSPPESSEAGERSASASLSMPVALRRSPGPQDRRGAGPGCRCAGRLRGEATGVTTPGVSPCAPWACPAAAYVSAHCPGHQADQRDDEEPPSDVDEVPAVVDLRGRWTRRLIANACRDPRQLSPDPEHGPRDHAGAEDGGWHPASHPARASTGGRHT